ncbi:MAG: hypothetical protein Q4D62_12285, partial [Planctomycetia bacterium]|nr:hypothetical protein [Planctomycetia bacterium]
NIPIIAITTNISTRVNPLLLLLERRFSTLSPPPSLTFLRQKLRSFVTLLNFRKNQSTGHHNLSLHQYNKFPRLWQELFPKFFHFFQKNSLFCRIPKETIHAPIRGE